MGAALGCAASVTCGEMGSRHGIFLRRPHGEAQPRTFDDVINEDAAFQQAERAKAKAKMAQLEGELIRTQGQLRRSQSELEAQRQQAKASRPAWHASFVSQPGADVYTQLTLHSFLGVVAAACLLTGKSVPALICLVCALAGGATAMAQLVAAGVKAFERKWGAPPAVSRF